MDDLAPAVERKLQVGALKLALLAAWAVLTFGGAFFARALDFPVFGWPFAYWFAAQGAILAFIAIVAFHAWAMNRLAPEDAAGAATDDPA